jgi:hypothetical protein
MEKWVGPGKGGVFFGGGSQETVSYLWGHNVVEQLRFADYKQPGVLKQLKSIVKCVGLTEN